MTSSLIQSGSPPARASRAMRTASSAVSAPEVFGSRRRSSGMKAVMSSSRASKSTRRTATVTISQPEASSASRITGNDGYFPVPVIRRDRKARPAIVNSSILAPSAGMTQIRFRGRGLRGRLSAPGQGLPCPAW
jgi:hypothetical protein